MSFPCLYCGQLCRTEAGRRSHVKQTLCNYTPGLPSAPPSPPSSEHSGSDDGNIGSHHDDYSNYQEDDQMDVDSSEADSLTIEYPNAEKVIGQGVTFMDDFNDNQFSKERELNVYYPFASRPEWETASFLLNSSLSMNEIDTYLKLDLTKKNNLSFNSAQRLNDLVDMLPPVPRWKFRKIDTLPLYPSKSPLVLYHRDALEVLQDLLKSPLIKDSLSFTPLQIFATSEKAMRIYDSWLSGTRAWDMQMQLPEGATLLSTILSSNKTNISVITGNWVAHPQFISLANIDSDLLSKASLHLFNLLALLPIPNYVEQRSLIRGVLENRLYHGCLDIVLEPLKTAACIGCMMSDPLGQLRVCFTPLASAVVDTPEATLIACVGGSAKTSPFTLAIASVAVRTNGVVHPFWRDWALAEPCEFLTPEPLHHWHKMFWDHDAKWAIQAVGGIQIDFLFSIHQSAVGYRHFKEAVSSKFVAALRSLTDFRYAGQAPRFSKTSSLRVQKALEEFHANKSEILSLKARVNPKGVFIDNWEIPKLEFLQSVEPSICASGPVMQWTADVTEHAHIYLVKDPARSGNNHDMEVFICRSLDRQARVRRFNLMTAMKDAQVDFHLGDVEGDEGGDGEHIQEGGNEEEITYISTTEELVTQLNPVSHKLFGSFHPKQNFFLKARLLRQILSAPLPHRVFTDEISGNIAAFSLVRDLDLKTMSIEDTSQLYLIQDFQGAISDFIDRFKAGIQTFVVGGRKNGNSQSIIPFTKSKTYFNWDLLADPHTIFAAPLGPSWEFGRSNAAIINIDPKFHWPRSSLEGMYPSPAIEGTHQFLAYCECLDVVNQPPPPPQYQHLPGYSAWPPYFPAYSSGCFILKRARRTDTTPLGDIIPISQFRSFADICPRYKGHPHTSLTQTTSQYCSEEFLLNKYFNKEIFFALDKVDPCPTNTAK
ncbi:uncharacterized protein C8R40DRAFT_1158970 [Lentinula edodes]|uniref:uncharacterized protein n=1 Tax=Lentinula edodes TaxID=5353 RepID=UPI001E8DE7E9|nr:uncharacterized protein C8R40DRAFT_1158970 [Lentinula edodes]KAH7879129.1 hypothetical protein C8R40DRAFT_1158970 [Lentinula edodes]